MLPNWIGIMKGISVYLADDELAFLDKKVRQGYKISSLVRCIILEWIKNEGDKDGSK